MQLNKFFLSRHLTWSLVFSIGLHAGVAAALLYVFAEQTKIQPETESAPLAVMMVNVATFAAPQLAAAEPEPVEETLSEPPVLPEPVPVLVPEPVKPKSKSKPKPVKKEIKKSDMKKVEAPRDDMPFKSDEPALIAKSAPITSAPEASMPGMSTSTGRPKALSKAKPTYPARALALGVEGQVKVQYDIDEDGRVTNIRILEATPRNTFEREVKQVMRKWRFEAVAAKNYMTTIVFKIGGEMDMN